MTATVGLLFPGELRDPATWSGTPSGIVAGLERARVAVVTLRAEPPRAAAKAATAAVALLRAHRTLRPPLAGAKTLTRAVARASPELGTLQTWTARASLRRLQRPLDGLVQIGAGYEPRPRDVPVVTFEDITIPQAVELGYPEWRALSRRAVAARIDRQRRVYEHARACCLTTAWAAEAVIREYGIEPEKVHVVGIGRNSEPRPVERDWSAPRFLFVGQDWVGKNGPLLLRAFARVRAEVPAARLDLVGAHPQVDEPGVTGHGFLRRGDAQARRRVEDLFERATALVVPSCYEATGIVFVEAAAAGIPAIGTTAGGSGDLIGDAGFVVDPHDENGLVDAMLALADPAVAADLGARARRRASLYTWDLVAGRILRALRPAGVTGDSLPAFL